MDTLLGVGLGNALMATLLALVAAGVGLVCRRPAVVHGLWLLVVLKLLTPPLLPLPLPWPLADGPARPEVALDARARKDVVSSPTADVASEAQTLAEIVESPEATSREPLGVVDGLSRQPAGEPAKGVARSWVVSWQGILGVVWLTGSLIWLTLAVLRIGRDDRWYNLRAGCRRLFVYDALQTGRAGLSSKLRSA